MSLKLGGRGHSWILSREMICARGQGRA
jgi:hypothetical protein